MYLYVLSPQTKVLLPDGYSTSCTSKRWICFQLYFYQMDPLLVSLRDGSTPAVPLPCGWVSSRCNSTRWTCYQNYSYQMDPVPDGSATICTSTSQIYGQMDPPLVVLLFYNMVPRLTVQCKPSYWIDPLQIVLLTITPFLPTVQVYMH